MRALRFETLQALFDAFPTARIDIGREPDAGPVLGSLHSFVERKTWDKAVSLCAYLLPRREAVWWGCRSLRHMQAKLSSAENAAIDAAEAWVKEPEDELRQQALKIGMLGDDRCAATWMALSAGWSGGNLAPSEYGAVPVEPYQTARAVRAGLLIAFAGIPRDNMATTIQACIDNALELLRR